MSSSSRYWKFVLGALLLMGCDDKKNSPAPPVDQKPKTPTVDDSPKPGDTPKSTSPDASRATTEGNPKPSTPGAAPTIRERATTLLTDLKSAIDQGKLADADVSLKRLDAMKD